MKRSSHKRHKFASLGQGFAEYAIILAFVGVSALITVTILDPTLGTVFSRITRSEPISPPALVDYVAQATPTGASPTQTPSGPTPTATNTPLPTATYTPIPGPTGGCGLILEAETAVLSGNMRINSNLHPGASAGKYIYVPDGTGDNLTGPNNDSATFNFTVTQADTYRFLGYTFAEDDTSNSFFVEIDGNRNDWDIELSGNFAPDYINRSTGTPTDPVEKDLDVGNHTIVVSLREDGARLDRIILECSSAPLNPTPTPQVNNCEQTFEAEAATLTGSMTAVNDSNASGGQYVHATGPDNYSGPNSDAMTFNVTVTEDRDYQLIGYVYSDSGSRDSFWVTLDGTEALWDVEQNTSYNSDYVSHRGGDDPVIFDLNAGTYDIIVSLREDGTRLDKLVLQCADTTTTSNFLQPADNLCQNGNARVSQSSTNYGGAATRACDGNRDGVYNNGSVTHTNNDTNAWWEVDLGRVYVLQQIKLFNRTDCCSSRLSNFYVFVSDEPFSSTDPTATANHPAVDAYYFEGGVDSLAYAFSLQSGRYIRIQLTGSNPLSLAEVEIYGSLQVPPSCEAVVDMFYVFDVSGSMGWDFDGTTTKIQAARDAVINLNNTIGTDNPDHRIGFVTFTTNGSYSNNGYWHYPIVLDNVALNSDISNTNAIVAGWNAQAGTPTSAALNEARLTMVNDWDPLRIPIIVLVSDGVPTIDQTERGYSDSTVQNVVVYDNNGDPYTADYVATTGGGNPQAGIVVADVMREAQELMNTLPNATMHSIAIGGSGFNTEVLQYVADVGGGQYFSASNSNELSNQLLSIFNGATCEVDS